MDRNDISYLQDGTYARESDGALHMWHSPYKFNNGAAALGNMDKRDSWRIVRNPAELQSVATSSAGTFSPESFSRSDHCTEPSPRKALRSG